MCVCLCVVLFQQTSGLGSPSVLRFRIGELTPIGLYTHKNTSIQKYLLVVELKAFAKPTSFYTRKPPVHFFWAEPVIKLRVF